MFFFIVQAPAAKAGQPAKLQAAAEKKDTQQVFWHSFVYVLQECFAVSLHYHVDFIIMIHWKMQQLSYVGWLMHVQLVNSHLHAFTS